MISVMVLVSNITFVIISHNYVAGSMARILIVQGNLKIVNLKKGIEILKKVTKQGEAVCI